MKTIVLAVAVCLVGCAELEPNPEWTVKGPSGASEAIAIIKARLGNYEYLPVVWYGPKALESCPGDDLNFVSPDTGECIGGITGTNLSIVGWDGKLTPVWTALAHELTHQVRGDHNHVNAAVWGSRGLDDYVRGTVVGDINLELIALGLH